MLIGNITRIHMTPVGHSGGVYASRERSVWGGISVSSNILQYTALDQKSAYPSGYRPPYSLIIPIKEGDLGLTGLGMISLGEVEAANLAGGLNAVSQLFGEGSISNAEASLLAFLLATINGTGELDGDIAGGLLALCTLTGVGEISNADLTDGITRINISSNILGLSNVVVDIIGGKNMEAIINGDGNIIPLLEAFANLVIEINSGGDLTDALLNAKANISANITPFTELSPESLAASVWNAIATEFNTPGTMGNKLNLASSGGVDYEELARAVWDKVLPE